MYANVFCGTAFTSNSPKEVNVLRDALFCIDDNGMIERIIHPEDETYSTVFNQYKNTDRFEQIPEGSYFLPGFIDLHIHASQWAQAGTALDMPLHEWLNT